MAKLYTVDDITERTNFTRDGRVQKLYKVTATTKSGTTFTVEIPEAEFTTEVVDKILTERTALIDSIKKL